MTMILSWLFNKNIYKLVKIGEIKKGGLPATLRLCF
jgi:hypothetical protein